MDGASDVVASATCVLEIEELERMPERDRAALFSPAETAYARSRTDPERRLAARLAAKRAVRRLLGEDLAAGEIEVLPSRGGPPGLRLGTEAGARLRALGAARALVSLTHERRHAAAAVLLVRGAERGPGTK
jgi:phosphopantetheinyl transferase (holo-ACP synthase)